MKAAPHRTRETSPLVAAIVRRSAHVVAVAPRPEEIQADIDAIELAFRLQRVRRYFGQLYWERESLEAEFADRIEDGLKLENVAAHSWHVADTVLILASHFPEINADRAVCLAILHDKLEIFTGDFDPIGSDGMGTFTHAFNETARSQKELEEREALDTYVSMLRVSLQDRQRELFTELATNESNEAKFVKSIDKLQALAYVNVKKNGDILDEHLKFTIRYSAKCIEYWPKLRFHYESMLERVLSAVAAKRLVRREDLDRTLFEQLELCI